MTFRELIASYAREYLAEKVDEYGKPSPYSGSETRGTWIVKTAAKDVISKELAGEIKLITGQARKAISSKLLSPYFRSLKLMTNKYPFLIECGQFRSRVKSEEEVAKIVSKLKNKEYLKIYKSKTIKGKKKWELI